MRDVTVFQGKLVLDSLKDILLSPVSLGAARAFIFHSRMLRDAIDRALDAVHNKLHRRG